MRKTECFKIGVEALGFLLVVAMGCAISLASVKPVASKQALPTPTQDVAVTVMPKHGTGTITRHYTHTENVGGEIQRSVVTVHESKKQNAFIRQFGEEEYPKTFVEFDDGTIHFDFGTNLIPTQALYPIAASDQRKYHLEKANGLGAEVSLVAEANETLVVNGLRYATLHLHALIPIAKGNVADIDLWLTADGKLVRYTRSMDNIFELSWEIQEGPKQDVGIASN